MIDMRRQIVLFAVIVILIAFGVWRVYAGKIALDPIIKDCLDKYSFLHYTGCSDNCAGGNGDYAFYSNTFVPSSKSGFVIPKDVMNASVAVFSVSVCRNCFQKFKIRENKEFKEVNLKDFCRFIAQYNKKCGGCLAVFRAERE
jgi:hypothetical protein